MKVNSSHVELAPIKESTAEYEQMEARIKAVFKRLFYAPILRELGSSTTVLKNAPRKNVKSNEDIFYEALNSGKITVNEDGMIRGKFSAGITKYIRSLGGKYSSGGKAFYIPVDNWPMQFRAAVSTAEARHQERLKRIDKTISQISPATIAENVKTSDLFARAAEKTNDLIAKSLKGYGIIPKLNAKEKQKIADEWQNNMDLWITNFTEQEIIRLRKDIAENVTSGNRHEAIVQSLQQSYGVTARKAKFLARQETALLMAKFKETRYTKVSDEYKWGCVAGSKNHPVRPSHKILEGKIFKWQTPPVTSMPNEPARRNNPGCDYNCRCFARPIIRFKSVK